LTVIAFPPLRSTIHANIGAIAQTKAELQVYRRPEYPIQDAVRQVVDMGLPIRHFERALSTDRGNPTANRRLGMIELALGKYDAALEHLAVAHAVEPKNQTTSQLLGEVLIVSGQIDDGTALWRTVDSAQGQLSIRTWWYRYTGDEQRAKWLADAAATKQSVETELSSP